MGKLKEIYIDLQNKYGVNLEDAPNDFSIDSYLESLSEIVVNFPNIGETNLKLETVRKWDITDIKEIGDTVFFSYGGTCLSVKSKDFNLIKLK